MLIVQQLTSEVIISKSLLALALKVANFIYGVKLSKVLLSTKKNDNILNLKTLEQGLNCMGIGIATVAPL